MDISQWKDRRGESGEPVHWLKNVAFRKPVLPGNQLIDFQEKQQQNLMHIWNYTVQQKAREGVIGTSHFDKM